MKNKFLLAALPAILMVLAFAPAGTSKLIVEVNNIKNLSGKPVIVGVFDKNGFPTVGKAKYEKSIKANSNKILFEFEIPDGDYAIAVSHDLNANGKLDMNFLGIPKEPYGFSNNYKPSLSAPKFEDCRFTLSGSEKKLTISLID